MTKLEEILNDYYVTGENLTVTDYIKAMTDGLSKEEMDVELQNLLLHLDKEIG